MGRLTELLQYEFIYDSNSIVKSLAYPDTPKLNLWPKDWICPSDQVLSGCYSRWSLCMWPTSLVHTYLHPCPLSHWESSGDFSRAGRTSLDFNFVRNAAEGTLWTPSNKIINGKVWDHLSASLSWMRIPFPIPLPAEGKLDMLWSDSHRTIQPCHIFTMDESDFYGPTHPVVWALPCQWALSGVPQFKRITESIDWQGRARTTGVCKSDVIDCEVHYGLHGQLHCQ